MSAQPISNTAKLLLRDERGELVAVLEHAKGKMIAYYVARGCTLEKKSILENKEAEIEFAAPISLRYMLHGDHYSVNACARGGGTRPAVVRSVEKAGGIQRFFRIDHEKLSDWLSRIER